MSDNDPDLPRRLDLTEQTALKMSGLLSVRCQLAGQDESEAVRYFSCSVRLSWRECLATMEGNAGFCWPRDEDAQGNATGPATETCEMRRSANQIRTHLGTP